MTDNIIQLHDDVQAVATCIDCNSKLWKLVLDKPGDDWERILGTECANCGYFCEWQVLKLRSDGQCAKDG